MRNRLLQLEETSRLLEPSTDCRNTIRSAVVIYSEEFLSNVDYKKAFELSVGTSSWLKERPIAEDGIGIDEALRLISENVDTPGLNPASGGHLGYIPGG